MAVVKLYSLAIFAEKERERERESQWGHIFTNPPKLVLQIPKMCQPSPVRYWMVVRNFPRSIRAQSRRYGSQTVTKNEVG